MELINVIERRALLNDCSDGRTCLRIGLSCDHGLGHHDGSVRHLDRHDDLLCLCLVSGCDDVHHHHRLLLDSINYLIATVGCHRHRRRNVAVASSYGDGAVSSEAQYFHPMDLHVDRSAGCSCRGLEAAVEPSASCYELPARLKNAITSGTVYDSVKVVDSGSFDGRVHLPFVEGQRCSTEADNDVRYIIKNLGYIYGVLTHHVNGSFHLQEGRLCHLFVFAWTRNVSLGRTALISNLSPGRI